VLSLLKMIIFVQLF